MKLKNIDQVHEFLKVVNECEGDVYLTSQYGDKYNLKSKLSQYIAVAALLESMVMSLRSGVSIKMMRRSFSTT